MTLHYQGRAIAAAHFGAHEIGEGWLWSDGAWHQVFASSASFGDGMLVKAENQTIATSQWVRIRGWRAEGLVIAEDDGIRVPAGVSVKVTATLDYIGNGTYNTSQRFRVMNGTQNLGEGSRNFANPGPFSVTASFVGTGDLVFMEGFVNQSSSNRNIVRAELTTLEVEVVS